MRLTFHQRSATNDNTVDEELMASVYINSVLTVRYKDFLKGGV